MDALKQKINSFRHFSAFHDSMDALSSLSSAESEIISGQQRAFGAHLREYAKVQKGEGARGLVELSDAGTQQIQIEQSSASRLERLPLALKPLLAHETEMSKWFSLSKKLLLVAEKSHHELEKAEAKVVKARARGDRSSISKAESAMASAKLRSESDEQSASAQQLAVEERVVPFRTTFRRSFVHPFIKALDMHFIASERMYAASDLFREAALLLENFDDPLIPRYRSTLASLEHET